MAKCLIAVREPGKKLGPAFAEAAFKEFPNVFGYASPQGEEGIHCRSFREGEEIEEGKKLDLKDALAEIEKTYASDRVFYVWMVLAEGEEIDDDNLQPAKIITDGEGEEEKCSLVCISDGEFVDFATEEETSETNDTRMIQQHIMPKIGELAEMADGDLKMLTGLLHKAPFKEYISTKLGPRGAITFITSSQDDKSAISVADGIEHGTWSWGWSSRTLGITDKPAVSEKKKTISLKKPSAEAKEKAAETAAEAVSPEKKFEKLLKDPDNRFYLKDSVLWTRPWNKGAKWKEMRAMWLRHFGADKLPRDETTPEVGKVLSQGLPFNELKQDSNIRIWAEGVLNPRPRTAASVQAEVTDDDEKKAKEREEKKEKEPGETSFHISKEHRDRYDNLRKAGVISFTDEDTLLKTARKYPKASNFFGEKSNEMMLISNDSLARIGHDVSIHAALCLANEWRFVALGLYAKLGETKHVEAAPAAAAAPARKTISLKKTA